ncbi:MAG: thymidylate kinase [Candidatus Berkelbacteria bacterium]|nr:MAG: thymidylate kinase [Candidatus Berkelbacteria bacterium]QQG51837.1 MAG: thymidylate kinase [Candidatus Berkelbacteria bacterium]
MAKGKVIVFGGNDGVGKRTQTQLFVERLNKSGRISPAKAIFYTFPDYDSFWGGLVSRYLGRGEALDEVIAGDPLQASMLYELDRRVVAVNSMIPELKKGNWVVCDRYVESNLAHQTVKFKNKKEQEHFIKVLTYLQHEYFELPKPDLVLILTLPAAVRAEQTEKRRREFMAKSGGKTHAQVAERDRHEQDLAYMESVNSYYPKLARRFNWPIVDCSKNGEQLSREEISDKVWRIVSKKYHFA